jgi:hypothetical protein
LVDAVTSAPIGFPHRKDRLTEAAAKIGTGEIALSEDEARDCAAGAYNPRLFDLLWKILRAQGAAGQVTGERAG